MGGGGERWLWTTCLVMGLVFALPYAVFSYLPLTDMPLHQLTLATWAQPERFGVFYERESYWLPYWTPLFVARPLAPILGIEAAGRVPIFLYVAVLPLTSAMLSRAAGRSGYWGLLLSAFALELNLAWGFVGYCLAGVLFQVVLACALRAESARRPVAWLGAGALASAVLGFTHPQVAAAAVGSCLLLAVLGPRAARARRAVAAAVGMLALVPSVVYFSDAARSTAFHLRGGIKFASAGELLRRLPEFSIDVFDGPVEEALFVCAVALLALSWRASRRPSLATMRIPLLAIGFLAAYFIAPFDWNGQAVGQRMPFLALLCLPCVAAPDGRPSFLLRSIIGAIATIGAANAAIALYAFNRDTAAELDPLLAAAPVGAKTVYFAYDASASGFRSLPYLHTGAYVVLRKGGVYAFHFNRLNTHYRDTVPRNQTMIGRELVLSRRQARGETVVWSADDMSFWDTVLVRFPRDDAPFVPLRGIAPETMTVHLGHRFGLFQLPDR